MALLKKTKRPSTARLQQAPARPNQRGQVSTRPPVFDVIKPSSGNIAVHASSKPVLVTNTPQVEDPTVTSRPSRSLAPPKDEPVVIDDRQTAPPLTRAHKTVIQPLNTIEPSEVESKPTPEPVVDEAPEEVVAKDEASIEEIPVELELPSDVDEPEETKADEQPLDPVAAKALEIEQREAAAEKLIENETYFLPINAAQERRTRRFAAVGIGIIIVLSALWYNAALDASLVDNTLNLPHTSFFRIET